MLLQVYIKKSTFHKKIELQGFITTKEIPMSCTQPHVYCVYVSDQTQALPLYAQQIFFH